MCLCPFLDREEWCCVVAIANDPKLLKKIPLQACKVAEIEPTQWALQPDKVKEIVKSGDFNGGLVINRRGELLLYDGHHRIAAAEEAGKDTIRCRVLDLPDNKALGLAGFAKLLGVEKYDILSAMDTDDRAWLE